MARPKVRMSDRGPCNDVHTFKLCNCIRLLFCAIYACDLSYFMSSNRLKSLGAAGYKSCVLVAHDWGGGVAWAFGRHYQELVDKLIIMNAPPAPIFREMLQKNKKQIRMSW